MLNIENIDINEYYTIKEACQLLNIHRNTLLKYTNMGLLKVYFHKTNKKMYKGIDIKKFMTAFL